MTIHKRMRTSLILTLLLISGLCSGQNKKSVYQGFPSLVWPKLYDISFEKKQDQLGEFEKPIFNSSTKALNGKTVTLPGYMVPFDGGLKGSEFMLSSLPLNACF